MEVLVIGSDERVVIEECLDGKEGSIMALTDERRLPHHRTTNRYMIMIRALIQLGWIHYCLLLTTMAIREAVGKNGKRRLIKN